MKRVDFLSNMSADAARHRMVSFSDRYKRQWSEWIAIAEKKPLTSDVSIAHFRRVLGRWQAVRSGTKGRMLRRCRTTANSADVCMDDLLREAVPFVEELGALTLRDLPKLSQRQERAMTFLWEIFRSLPTIGTANAVGITKAVKLITFGRIGPALDREVRRALAIDEPRNAEEWIQALRAISEDLSRFETATGKRLEDLVEPRYRPVAIGRAYDMAAGPRSGKGAV